MFQGQSIKLQSLDNGYAELVFDRQGDAINKFDARTVQELFQAAEELQGSGVKGLVISSAKDAFIVGADITEFGTNFKAPEAEIVEWTVKANEAFNAIEDLPFPTVSAINGLALGGGLELTLATDYRVLADTAQVGFPEVKLGLYPGFGGTVRAPRLIGADNAIEMIAGGEQVKADAALKLHLVDAVTKVDKLKAAAIRLLDLANSGKLDYQARRAQKTGRLKLSPLEQMMVFNTSKGFIAGKAGKNYPAPLAAVATIEKSVNKTRADALRNEAQGFAKLAKTSVSDALIGLFLNDQFLKKKAKAASKIAKPVNHAAVLGAGIMGGGIAYQSASKGTPIIMKDINDHALELGMEEANKLLSAQVDRKKMTALQAGETLAEIRPTLNYGDFQGVDVVVEAVVENPKVKKAVLAEVEGIVKEGTIIASNTSSISIDELATAMKHPENFLGMHFFNPVHKMPLVEVIYGEKTSREAIATIVAYATKMGKTAIVVKNCPGFLVNRILFPYFGGWSAILRDGADYQKVDRVMEGFGWPMGPSYLQDVVGIDTSHHVGDVLAEGYPDRMGKDFRTALDVMYDAKRYGQKTGSGFYKYTTDPKGKPVKAVDPETATLIAQVQTGAARDFSDEEIIDRLMLPLLIETVRCLDEGIVTSPTEADMGLIMGIGFPPFRGGALKYIDTVGIQAVIDKCEKYKDLGALYQPTESMRKLATEGGKYYGTNTEPAAPADGRKTDAAAPAAATA